MGINDEEWWNSWFDSFFPVEHGGCHQQEFNKNVDLAT